MPSDFGKDDYEFAHTKYIFKSIFILWMAVHLSSWILINDALVNVKQLDLQERKKEKERGGERRRS